MDRLLIYQISATNLGKLLMPDELWYNQHYHMTRQQPRISLNRRLLSSKLVLLIGIVVLIGIGATLAKEVHKSYRIHQEIEHIRAEVNRLERHHQELLASLEYFKTDSFKEREARQKLGLQKDGETAVAIPLPKAIVLDEEVVSGSNSQHIQPVSNPRKWWNYFFTFN
jgi:cell division protein FtsB